MLVIDLKQELKVIEKIPIMKKEDGSTNESLCNGHSTRTQVEIETQTSLSSPARRKYSIILSIIYYDKLIINNKALQENKNSYFNYLKSLCVCIIFLSLGEINGNAMTPSSRVTAINIVGDLLRRVGVSCIKIMFIGVVFIAVVTIGTTCTQPLHFI